MSRFKLVAIMVQAAKDSRDDITRDEVVEAILLKHIKRDKKFKEWQKEQKSWWIVDFLYIQTYI